MCGDVYKGVQTRGQVNGRKGGCRGDTGGRPEVAHYGHQLPLAMMAKPFVHTRSIDNSILSMTHRVSVTPALSAHRRPDML